MGFPVPFSGWVRGRWNDVARQVLLDRRTCQRGLINRSAVEHLLDDHRAGRTAGGDAIWALMNLELWYRTFIDGDGIQTLPVGRPEAGSAARTPAYVGQEGNPDDVGRAGSAERTRHDQPTAAA
jgi:hypothetical protein